MDFLGTCPQLSPEEEEKRRIRRERNKLAAAKCRNRRRELTEKLQAVRALHFSFLVTHPPDQLQGHCFSSTSIFKEDASNIPCLPHPRLSKGTASLSTVADEEDLGLELKTLKFSLPSTQNVLGALFPSHLSTSTSFPDSGHLS